MQAELERFGRGIRVLYMCAASVRPSFQYHHRNPVPSAEFCRYREASHSCADYDRLYIDQRFH
jgi:hypothetical protein